MHFTTPHNNIGFNSKGSEDMTTEITKKMPVLTNPLSFEAPSPRTPTNIRMNLIPLESRVPGLHLYCLQCASTFKLPW